MNAWQILQWLERHGRQVVIQEIPAYRRSKNRCIVEWKDDGGTHAVGGYSIADAVSKAQVRNKTLPAPNDLAIPEPQMGLESIGKEAHGRNHLS